MFKTEYLPFWNFALSPVRLFDFSRYLYKVFLLSIYNYTLQLLDLCSFVPLLMIEILKILHLTRIEFKKASNTTH